MTPLRFRAWHQDSNRMISDDAGLTLRLDGTLLRQKWDDFNSVNDHYVLMQSTGLKDKNGVEIWEGDIVKRKVTANKELHGEYSYQEVKLNGCVPILSYLYSDTGAKLPPGYTAGLLTDYYPIKPLVFFEGEPEPEDDLEIIGNLYENPDLLPPSA